MLEFISVVLYIIRMISYAQRFMLLAAVWLPAAGGLFARAQSERTADLVVNDPEVRYGVLPNGLTYYVRANSVPEGMADLRLAVRAGAVLEDEDQRGLAHFLEHMLFNGTEKYPANEIVEVLESFGMAFGPEINAYTSFDETVYQLSVSTKEKEQLLVGLDVLEEWAFHAALDEEEFEKERGVIHEEWRMGRGVNARMRDEILPLLWGGRYAERLPIGDMDVVLNAPVEALRRFYEDWYRPDLMAVIAVGDFDPDEVRELITDRFGTYPGPENPRPRPEYSVPRHEETRVKVIHDPEAVHTTAYVYRKYDIPRWNRRSEQRHYLAQALFLTMFNDRLGEISRNEDAPFLSGSAQFTWDFSHDTSLVSLKAGVEEEGALDGLAAIIAEMERVQRFGFLPSELDRAKSNVMGSFRNYWKQRNDMDSSHFVQYYLSAFLNDDTFPSIEWQWELVQEILPGITLEEISEIAENFLADSDRVAVVQGPSVPAVTDIGEDDIFEILRDAQGVALTPWEDNTVTGSLVENPPTPGRIITRSTIPGTDIERWVLSNGAVLIFKDTDFKAEEILFEAVSPGGASRVEDSQYVSSKLASDTVSQGGLGQFSVDDLNKIFTGVTADVSPFIHEYYEGLSGMAVTEDLEALFQLIYLHHTAPRRDQVSWEAMMNRTAESLRNRESSPMIVYEDLLWQTICDNHFRCRPVTADRLGEANLDDALDIYLERFRDAGDFTYVFVGDLDAETLESLAVRWLAGLPEAEENGGWIDREIRNVSGNKEISVEAGSEPLSVITQVWTGDWNGSYVESYKLQSLAAAMEMQLTKTIREDFGGTYSVGVFSNLNLNPVADYRFFIQYSADPERVDELISRVRDIVDDWRSSPPNEKFAADVAANQRRRLSENINSNQWWKKQIVFAVTTGTSPEALLNRNELYDSLNPEVLMETARRYLNDDNYIEAVLYPDPKAELQE